jgi:hypothetical protein
MIHRIIELECIIFNFNRKLEGHLLPSRVAMQIIAKADNAKDGNG